MHLALYVVRCPVDKTILAAAVDSMASAQKAAGPIDCPTCTLKAEFEKRLAALEARIDRSAREALREALADAWHTTRELMNQERESDGLPPLAPEDNPHRRQESHPPASAPVPMTVPDAETFKRLVDEGEALRKAADRDRARAEAAPPPASEAEPELCYAELSPGRPCMLSFGHYPTTMHRTHDGTGWITNEAPPRDERPVTRDRDLLAVMAAVLWSSSKGRVQTWSMSQAIEYAHEIVAEIDDEDRVAGPKSGAP